MKNVKYILRLTLTLLLVTSLVAAALADPCCKTNPIPVTAALLRRILQEVSGVG